MSTWKKIIVSGSDAVLNSVTASNGYFGTASYSLLSISSSYSTTASYVLNAVSSSFSTNSMTASYYGGTVTSASFASTASFLSGGVTSASFATNSMTASYVLNAVSASRATTAATASVATSASYAAIPQFPTFNVAGANSLTTFFVNTDLNQDNNFNRNITWGDLLTDIAGTNLASDGDSVNLNTTITGLTSVSSTSFTGSLQGTATTASYYGGTVTSASFASTASFVNTLTQNVTVSGSIFLSGSLNTPVFIDYEERFTSPTISAGGLTLNLANGNVFNVALNAAITTLTISSPPATNNAGSFVLIFTADGTPRAVSWGASILWPGGTAPTLTSTNGKKDVFGFISLNTGSNWYGFIGGQNI